MEFVRRWIEESPYSAALGIEVVSLEKSAAQLRLPFREKNSNPGKALHGGCAASLAVVGGQAVSRAAMGADSGPWHSCSLQVNYLSAAIDEAVVARVSLLRRGKKLCFAEVSIETEEGKPIAHATTAVRGRFGADPAPALRSRGDDGQSDPGVMGPHVGKLPFMAARGIHVEHMTGGTSRLVMPFQSGDADAVGGVHEGAVLALLDTTGAMASWAQTGPGPYQASTPSLQAQILEPAPKDDLVAYGRNVQRDDELLWSDVEIAAAGDGRVVARGTVIYRIVT